MASKRILVIESERSIFDSLKSMFSDFDVETMVLEDGQQSLQTIKETRPDLVLLSVELPGVSGYSICTKMKKDKDLKRIPLIMMSSEATEETFDQHRKLKTRADDYIAKPFSSDQIMEKAFALVDLPKIMATKVEEIITIDEEEAIIIDDEFPDLSGDDLPRESGEESGSSTDRLLSEGPGGDMENLDDVFDDIQLGGEEDAHNARTRVVTQEELPTTDPGDEFDEVLGTLKEMDDAEKRAEKTQVMAEPGGEIPIPSGAEAFGSESTEDAMASLDAVLRETEDFEERPSRPRLWAKAETPEDLPPEADNFDDFTAERPPEAELLAADADEDDLVGALDAPSQKNEPEDDLQAELKSSAAEPDDSDSDGLEEFSSQPAPSAAVIPPVGKFEAPAFTMPPAAEPRPSLATSSYVPKAGSDPLLLTKLQHTEEANRQLREKVSALESKLEERHHAFEKRDSELGNLRGTTATKDKEAFALKTSLNAKERELLDTREESNRKDAEILSVREKMVELEEELGHQQEVLAGRDREIKEYSDRLDTLQQQKHEVEVMFQAKMGEWEDRYNTQVRKLEEQLRSTQQESGKTIRELQEQLKAASDNVVRLQGELEENFQRHKDEVFGLRTRAKKEKEMLEGEIKTLNAEIEQLAHQFDEEQRAHAVTRELADRLPGLEEEIRMGQSTISGLEQQIADLQDEVAKGEERLMKAYQRLKDDEKLRDKERKIKEKARKAVEIAFTLLADQVEDEAGAMDQEPEPPEDLDEIQT